MYLKSGNILFQLLLQGCQPYLIKPLKKCDLEKSSTQCLQTPLCVKTKCTNPYYKPTGDKPTLFKSWYLYLPIQYTYTKFNILHCIYFTI